MLLGLTAAATPEQGGTQYNITADMDYGWLDLMYRMYPNMQGVFNTENFWAGIRLHAKEALRCWRLLTDSVDSLYGQIRITVLQ